MKKRPQILFLISLIISFFVSYGSYTIFAGPVDYTLSKICPDNYEADKDNEAGDGLFEPIEASLGFTCAKAVYHRRMNTYFNDKLEKLVEGKVSSLPPQVKAPEDLEKFTVDKFREVCGKEGENVSTYCVSMGALELYSNYLVTLQNIQKDLPQPQEIMDPQSDVNNTFLAKYTPISAVINSIANRYDEVTKEIELSQKVMEATIAAYEEFRTAYPMHQEYEKIIKDLVQYKNKLKSLRHDIMLFPGKFIDATSKSCP